MKQSFTQWILYILHGLQDFFLVIGKCWLSVLMIIFGGYAFLVNDQGIDVMTAFNENKNILLSLGAALSLFFWSVESWFGARVALSLSDLTRLTDASNTTLKRIMPRVLGILPIFIFYLSYLLFKDKYVWMDLIILFLPFIAFWFFIIRRRKLVRTLNETVLLKRFQVTIPPVPPVINEAIRFSQIDRNGKLFLWLPVIAFIITIILVCISPVAVPSFCTPLVVILLAIAVWTGLITWVAISEKTWRIPTTFLLCCMTLVFSLINNNHEIRTIDDKLKATDLSGNFSQWLKTVPLRADSSKTVVLACGEGGGIRAAYWTASVLASLTDSVRAFPGYLYALSTVSGSSLGSALFDALLYADGQGALPEKKFRDNVRRFIRVDYLSPVTAGFIFPDMLQRFLPFQWDRFDRARYLEWSWEKGWEKQLSARVNPFSKGILNLWKEKQSIPNLFLNGTHVEDGRRVITSNLSWDENSWQARNVTSIVNYDIPLSTAALLSARFPIITPGAKIIEYPSEYWGNVVDGGYYDNYGIVTISDIYNEIRKIYNSKKVRIVVLCIRNGGNIPLNPDPIKIAYEMQTVPKAFMNSWSVRPEKSLNMMQKILSEAGDTLINIDLDRKKTENLPLGWYLSEQAIAIMDTQLNGNEWRIKKGEILKLLK
jgi:hypothetical protein